MSGSELSGGKMSGGVLSGGKICGSKLSCGKLFGGEMSHTRFSLWEPDVTVLPSQWGHG